MAKVISKPRVMEDSDHSSLPLSSKTFTIAGILTTVFGLEELAPQTTETACLWLLHPRLQTQSCMQPFAAATIKDWNVRIHGGGGGTAAAVEGGSREPPPPRKGLIAVSFDQRNHGSREVDSVANNAWTNGNPRHAQDMFSIYHGTAIDTSLLLDYISAYAFPDDSVKITQNIVLGVSLGGHAAWQCLLHDPRINSAVVCIGTPDYTNLMADRARLSKLPTYRDSDPPGSTFVGSKDFPPALVDAVKKYDPAGLLLGQLPRAESRFAWTAEETMLEVSTDEKTALAPMMARTLWGKRILNLSGGADKLVPYRCGEPFLSWLKRAISPGGWYEEGGIVLEDLIFDGVGHEAAPSMVTEMVRFVSETLEGRAEGSEYIAKRESRI